MPRSSNWLSEFVSGDMRIGDRVVLDDPATVTSPLQQISVRCSCGNVSKMSVYNFVRMVSKTCGKCEFFKYRSSGVRKFNSLTILDEVLNFDQTVRARCDCGATIEASLRQIYSGRKKTCGHCTLNHFRKEKRTQFGELTLLTALDDIHGWVDEVDAICSCGNRVKIIYRNLATGNSKSCGRCVVTKLKAAGTTQFHNLTLLTPWQNINAKASRARFKCKCGHEQTMYLSNVVNGHTKQCGHCYSKYKTLHKQNKPSEVTYPIQPGALFGYIINRNVVENGKTRLDADCPLCGKEWHPKFNDVLRGMSLTCGCHTNRVSAQNEEIADFIRQLGCEAILEGKIGKFKYDVVVPGRMAIEHHGLRWHSYFKTNRATDMAKFNAAQQAGVIPLVIFSDEWTNKPEQVRDIIRHRLSKSNAMKMRPSQCELCEIDQHEADALYDRCHYLGKTGASINVGAVFKGQLLAAVSFKPPTRQSTHSLELVRMAADSRYHIHGIWSALFAQFLRKHNPRSIVSFSDNRLFDGRVYEKLGFVFDGNVRPDYYWTRGRVRCHKSALRKPTGEKTTESQLRESQGYAKIWDLGKKRWVWTSNSNPSGAPESHPDFH